MKKFLSTLFSVVLLLSCVSFLFAFPAQAASGLCGNNLTWSYNESTGTLTISGTGKMHDYINEATPWQPFYNTLKAVVINNGVTSIGNSAFYLYGYEYASKEYENLTSVTIPPSVTKVEEDAFFHCPALNIIRIADLAAWCDVDLFDAWEYPYDLYLNDSLITKLVIPAGVTVIREAVFAACKSLTSVTIPASVTDISGWAFNGCQNLASVTVLNKNVFIDRNAFGACAQNLVIRGYAGSTAELYAKTKGITFEAVTVTEPHVKKVELSDITMNYKTTAALNPTITADEGAEYTVKYESSDEKIATVDANGNITGVKRGTANITCIIADEANNTVTDTCKITVKYSVLQWIIKILLFGWIWY